jgi:hypothetical protein
MRKSNRKISWQKWLQLAATVAGALVASGVLLPGSIASKIVAAAVLVLANFGYGAKFGQRVLRVREFARPVRGFNAIPDYDADETTGLWMLKSDLEYLAQSGEVITVPAGFETDFFSIPRALKWLFVGIDSKYGPAAVIHDWLYRQQTGKRARADALLREAMRALGASWILAHVVYVGVRSFGWLGWAADKPKAEKQNVA